MIDVEHKFYDLEKVVSGRFIVIESMIKFGNNSIVPWEPVWSWFIKVFDYSQLSNFQETP